MVPVSAEELAYRIWRRFPKTYEQLYEHLTLSDAGVELGDLTTDQLLNELAGISPRIDLEWQYYEILGWMTNENQLRENYIKHQKRLRNPCG